MSTSNTITPPTWRLKFLRFFVKKEYLEEIEGDMHEIFQENVERVGLKKAKRVYAWEMTKLLRPILVKNLEGADRLNQYSMFKNYFKVSLRGLMKNPLNSTINVFGLAIAIGVAIFGYAFARWTYSTDQFHENKNEVFLVTFFADRDGTAQQFGTSPRPMGEMLRNDFPQIKKMCRVEDRDVVVKYEDQVFYERIRFTDPDFLNMFTFPLKWGSPASLRDVNSIILSEDMSTKYFGDESPIGQSILLKFDMDRSKMFKITGVAKEFPKAHTIDFHFLVNFENLRTSESAYDFHDWEKLTRATLIQADPVDIQTIMPGMEKYKALQNKAVNEDWAITSFAFEPLATLHERAGDIRDDISRSSNNNYKSVIYMCVIGLFLLILACFNYINIAIVSATRRLKEIGVRKSIGATRGVVIIQFLTENIVITCFSLALGLVLGGFVFIPWFEAQWDFSMDFTMRDQVLWIYLPGLLLFTGIASGIYPALYISNFQVVGILKGSVKFGTKSPLTKILLGFQVLLACMFMVGAVMFTQNSNYMAQQPWGYDQHEALYALVPDQLSFEQLSAVMARNPDVVSIAGSANHLGKNHATTVLHFPGREYEVDQLSVDPLYFKTMGLQLKAGRTFNDHDNSDKQAVVVNELMVEKMGWENPLGQTFLIDSVQYEVIGVLKEFHSFNFFRPLKPVIFRVADKTDYRYLSMKIREGKTLEVYRSLQAGWTELFPEIPFAGGFQEDVWGGYYTEIGIHSRVWRWFSFMALILASLGLYGLVTLNVSGRIREFSIRKVLGAGIKHIAASITGQYVVLFAIALFLGAPGGYFLMKILLSTAYAYHMPLNFSSAMIAVTLLILVLLITISTQIGKASKANPVDGLKIE